MHKTEKKDFSESNNIFNVKVVFIKIVEQWSPLQGLDVVY